MSGPTPPIIRGPRSTADGLFLLLLLPVMILGCASPGPPQPPSLHLPSQATGLVTERIGDEVLLSWTTPANTTDGDTIRGSITALVCRESGSLPPSKPARKPSPVQPPSCASIQRFAVTPGPSHATDRLPPALITGLPALLSYRVELFNSRSRSAGPSEPAFVAAGAAPPPVGELRVSSRREGTLIAWQPQPSPAPMELKRTLIASASGPVAPAAPSGRKSAKPSGLSLGEKKPPSTVVMLRPEQANKPGDPGGTLDRTVQDGDTYTYTAQRVLTVELAGHQLDLRGVPSPPATLAFRDIFPPQPPLGLQSVPGGGFGSAPSIDLSWEPSPETDLLGYNAYRCDIAPCTAPGSFVRLNPDPLPGPAFRDLKVEPGHTYVYRVTALDRHQNESAPSAEIRETLRK